MRDAENQPFSRMVDRLSELQGLISWWTPCGKWLRSELLLLAQLMRLTGAVTLSWSADQARGLRNDSATEPHDRAS